MVGKMVLGQKILTGLLIGGGSGWLVSPHSHQLEARLPWEGSSIPSKRLLTLGRTLNCLAESFLSKGHEPSPARSAHGTVHRCLWTTSLEDPCFGGKGLTKSGVTAMAGFDGSGVTSRPVLPALAFPKHPGLAQQSRPLLSKRLLFRDGHQWLARCAVKASQASPVR